MPRLSLSELKTVEFIRDGAVTVTVCENAEALRLIESALVYQRKVYHHPSAPGGRRRPSERIELVTKRCYQYVDDPGGPTKRQFVFASGHLPRVRCVLRSAGYESTVRRLRGCNSDGALSNPQWDRLRDVDFRFMQRETLELMVKRDYGQIKCPPGWGKSFAFGFYCDLFPTAKIDIAIMAVDVLGTLKDYLQERFPSIGIVTGAGHQNTDSRILLYSAKSLHHGYRAPNVLLVDELHEFGTDDNLARISAPRYRYAKKFGFSASCGDRSDAADFELEGVFGPIAVDVPYSEGVRTGCIVPIEVHWRDVVGNVDPIAGIDDPVTQERIALWQNRRRNQLIAADARSFHDDEQVLIVVETIEHAMYLKRELPEFQLCHSEVRLDPRIRYGYVESGCITADEPVMTSSRRKMLKHQFESGELKKVIANSVWKRGVNFRSLSVLIRADGKASRISDMQIPGRLSRVSAGKSSAILIDYRDQFSRLLRGRSQRRARNYESYGWEQIDPAISAERIRAVLPVRATRA